MPPWTSRVKCHAEEWETGIRNRVNEVATEVFGLGFELEEFATKGDDFGDGPSAAQLRRTVRVQTAARHQVAALERPGLRVEGHRLRVLFHTFQFG